MYHIYIGAPLMIPHPPALIFFGCGVFLFELSTPFLNLRYITCIYIICYMSMLILTRIRSMVNRGWSINFDQTAGPLFTLIQLLFALTFLVSRYIVIPLFLIIYPLIITLATLLNTLGYFGVSLSVYQWHYGFIIKTFALNSLYYGA